MYFVKICLRWRGCVDVILFESFPVPDMVGAVTTEAGLYTKPISLDPFDTAIVIEREKAERVVQIFRWVVGWAGQVRVLKPTALRKLVVEAHQRAIAANLKKSDQSAADCPQG
jgi:hypothetical protein